MLVTYKIDDMSHFVNETYEEGNRYRAWSWQPGDLIRKQVFEDDRDRPSREFPIGMVLWVNDNGGWDNNEIGILWSSDPSPRSTFRGPV